MIVSIRCSGWIQWWSGLAKYREVFDVISLVLQVRIGRWLVLLTHIPRAVGGLRWWIRISRTSWPGGRLVQGFECMVRGHTHSDVAIRRKNVNVSLEATGLRPVSPAGLEDMVTKAVRLKH